VLHCTDRTDIELCVLQASAWEEAGVVASRRYEASKEEVSRGLDEAREAVGRGLEAAAPVVRGAVEETGHVAAAAGEATRDAAARGLEATAPIVRAGWLRAREAMWSTSLGAASFSSMLVGRAVEASAGKQAREALETGVAATSSGLHATGAAVLHGWEVAAPVVSHLCSHSPRTPTAFVCALFPLY
jgi:hypothetical protein